MRSTAAALLAATLAFAAPPALADPVRLLPIELSVTLERYVGQEVSIPCLLFNADLQRAACSIPNDRGRHVGSIGLIIRHLDAETRRRIANDCTAQRPERGCRTVVTGTVEERFNGPFFERPDLRWVE